MTLPMKLQDWVDVHKIHWCWLTQYPNAMDLLKENLDKINWGCLSDKSNAMKWLEKNQDKIHWGW